MDFKEEAGSRGRSGSLTGISAQHEPAAVALAAEVGCLANSEHGGVLIVGVEDGAAGPGAFVGARSDADWLRRRIHALTQPAYTVDVEEIWSHGARLLLIDVPPALEEIRSGGRLRVRFGTACEELTGDLARQFLERRRNYDWTAEPSGLRFDAAVPAAIASARNKYQAARGAAPDSDLELCRRLGLFRTESDDHVNPEFNHAGALLLTEFEPTTEQFACSITEAEGVSSLRSLRGAAPLLLLFDDAWRFLTTEAFPAKTVVIGAVRRQLRPIPDIALRESLVNAMMHRDYRLTRRAVTVQAISGSTLKVRSPGGLVTGVRADRMIAAPSLARNPTLANASRILGLADREGVGIDTMYSLMLRDGHPEPAIEEDAGDVIVTLFGGNPDTLLASFFDDIVARDPALSDVRTAVAITHLLASRTLRAETLAAKAQCSLADADRTLARLQQAGVLERLVNRSLAYRFTESSLQALTDRVRYPAYRALDEHLELVRAFLDANPEIGRDEAASLLGVAPNYASRILSRLATEGRITPVANARGPRVRYRWTT